ncbi:MAG: TAXI family TRAP transporter solute-binding subunit, partial [Pilosibacter sp.]
IMVDDLVYEITSILYENRDRLKDLHPALSYASQTGFMYEDLPIELHPGAERYYAEQGLLQEHSR